MVQLILACTAALTAQQPLPSAPDPKPAPTPFKAPARTLPAPASAPAPVPDSKETEEDNLPGHLGVSTEAMDYRQELIFKDYFSNRLRPAIRHRWIDAMPEEANGKHKKFGPIHIDKKGKSGKVRVGFTLHKDGSVSDVNLEDSSGDKLLDMAAFNAVKDCQPGPLPAAFSRDQLKMRLIFYYNP